MRDDKRFWDLVGAEDVPMVEELRFFGCHETNVIFSP